MSEFKFPASFDKTITTTYVSKVPRNICDSVTKPVCKLQYILQIERWRPDRLALHDCQQMLAVIEVIVRILQFL
jgi:hypothetical protein